MGSGRSSDSVYQWLKERILSGRFPPGSELREADLCRETGMSRTPVREALNRLERENFLVYTYRKGVVVKEASVTDVLEVYDIQWCLERFAIELIFLNNTPPDLDLMRRLVEEERSVVEEGKVFEAFRLNREFHCAIARASGNRRLVRLVEDLRDWWIYAGQLTVRSRGDLGEAVAEHGEIIAAFAAGGLEECLRASYRHVCGGKRRMMGAGSVYQSGYGRLLAWIPLKEA